MDGMQGFYFGIAKAKVNYQALQQAFSFSL